MDWFGMQSMVACSFLQALLCKVLCFWNECESTLHCHTPPFCPRHSPHPCLLSLQVSFLLDLKVFSLCLNSECRMLYPRKIILMKLQAWKGLSWEFQCRVINCSLWLGTAVILEVVLHLFCASYLYFQIVACAGLDRSMHLEGDKQLD